MKNKAVILAQPRTGSELLVQLLGSHSRVRAESELLNRFPGGVTVLDFYFDEQDRVPDDRFYICKLMYNHVDDYVWSWLVDEQLPIIHVVRENELDRVLSHELERRKGEVGRTSAKAYEKLPVVKLAAQIPWVLDQCRRGFELRKMWRERIKVLPHIEIGYEELTGNSEIEAMDDKMRAKLLGFLGIPIEPLTVELRKQNPADKSQSITNYSEVLAQYHGLNYGRYE